MPENISNPVNNQGVSTETDRDQRDAISRQEEEEKKRLAEQREQESALQKDSLNSDDSEILKAEHYEPKMVEGDDEVFVENFGGTGAEFSSVKSKIFDMDLLEDGTLVKSQKRNPENRYLIGSNDEGVMEYDFSELDVADLNKDTLTFEFENLKRGEFDYEVHFSVDKEGNIEIDHLQGDAAGKSISRMVIRPLHSIKTGNWLKLKKPKSWKKKKLKATVKNQKTLMIKIS